MSLAGFRTAIITDVRVQPGVPTTLNAVLDVGSVAETITVTGSGAELINTQTAIVTATLNIDQLSGSRHLRAMRSTPCRIFPA